MYNDVYIPTYVDVIYRIRGIYSRNAYIGYGNVYQIEIHLNKSRRNLFGKKKQNTVNIKKNKIDIRNPFENIYIYIYK